MNFIVLKSQSVTCELK